MSAAPGGASPLPSAPAVDPSGFDPADRLLALAGTWNTRHVGGYPAADGRVVRDHVLIRADALHRLDDDGRSLLAGLGVRTVLDLRRLSEVEANPDLLDGVGADVHHLPLFDEGRGVGGIADFELTLEFVYRSLIEHSGPAFAQAVRMLAAPGALPGIVHCTAGKDRTGILTAMVLEVIGVPDELIALDYAATSGFLSDEYRDDLVATITAQGLEREVALELLSSDPELILATLGHARRLGGSVAGYLTTHGVTEAELESLREALLVEPA
jgi:protein-tyrosine phosphatase